MNKRLVTGYADNQPKWRYWVQPCYFNVTEWHQMDYWVRSIFGESNWSTTNGRWVGSDQKYWFCKEADRTLFLLRWS